MPDEKGKFTEVTFKFWCVGVENRNFFWREMGSSVNILCKILGWRLCSAGSLH